MVRTPVVRTSAPGKAFLVGDLVALDGAPAALMAVDRRIRMTFEPGDPGTGWVETFQNERKKRHRPLSKLLEITAEGDLLAAVVQQVANTGLELPEDVHILSDRRALIDPTGKSIGMGSSAAAAVSLTAAMTPKASKETIRRTAIAAHRRFQGGMGSGYDVACAVAGGVVIARPTEGDVTVTPSALPGGLDAMLVGGGEPLSTRVVARAITTLPVRPPAWRDLMLLSLDAVEKVAEGDGPGLIEAVRTLLPAIAEVGRGVGLELVTPRIQALAAKIEALGGACKPSGAGGDELVVIFIAESEVKAAREAAQSVGLQPRGATLDPRGLWIGHR